jgi:hypothetical protein
MVLSSLCQPLYGRILNQLTWNTNVRAKREGTVLRYGSAGVCRVSDRGLRDGLLCLLIDVCVCVCGLFRDPATSRHCTARGGKVIDEWWVDMGVQRSGHGLF